MGNQRFKDKDTIFIIKTCIYSQLQTEDLIDFYLPRDRKILPLNKIKEALILSTDDNDYRLVKDRFKGVGSVDTIPLLTPNDFEKLAQYYLVWYKPNNNNDRGYNVDGSVNFCLSEYIISFQNKEERARLPHNDKVYKIIEKLKHGWNYTIEIIVACDTSINVGLIVESVSHALALCYLRLDQPELLQELLKINSDVKLCQMNSNQCRDIFSYDFAKIAPSSSTSTSTTTHS
jgi:hypothetical protein